MPLSFEEIRLPFLPGVPGGTSAAGAGASFYNDNSPRLRTLFLDAVRLAGRVAFLKARSIAQSGRTVATTFNPYSFLVCQRIPRAVCVVASAYPPFVVSRHGWLLRFEAHSNTGGWREADNLWRETDNAERR